MTDVEGEEDGRMGLGEIGRRETEAADAEGEGNEGAWVGEARR